MSTAATILFYAYEYVGIKLAYFSICYHINFELAILTSYTSILCKAANILHLIWE